MSKEGACKQSLSIYTCHVYEHSRVKVDHMMSRLSFAANKYKWERIIRWRKYAVSKLYLIVQRFLRARDVKTLLHEEMWVAMQIWVKKIFL